MLEVADVEDGKLQPQVACKKFVHANFDPRFWSIVTWSGR